MSLSGTGELDGLTGLNITRQAAGDGAVCLVAVPATSAGAAAALDMLVKVGAAVDGCLGDQTVRAIVISCTSSALADASRSAGAPSGSSLRPAGQAETATATETETAESEMDALDATAYALAGQEALHVIESSPVPVIAAISGSCYDAALDLALACDLRVAARNATFAVTQASRGACSGFGGMARLARLVGPGAAKLLCLDGQPISAEEALRLGLVERVVAVGEHVHSATALASRVAAASPRVVAATKEAIDGGLVLPLPDALRLEAAVCGAVAADETARAWRRANRANHAAEGPAD